MEADHSSVFESCSHHSHLLQANEGISIRIADSASIHPLQAGSSDLVSVEQVSAVGTNMHVR